MELVVVVLTLLFQNYRRKDICSNTPLPQLKEMKGVFLLCRRGIGKFEILPPIVSQLQESNLILFSKSLLHSSTNSATSRSRSSSLHNYYLRKRRRWLLSPYKTHWHIAFAHQQAMQNLKKSVKTHLLTALIDSFAMYECDPSPNAYHFVIKLLFKNPSKWDQIPQVLDHIQKVATFETPEYILIDLIQFYGDCNMIHHAVELFYKIPKFRCNPSVHSLKALLLVLCEKGSLGIVPQVLIKSQVMNIRIEESCFGILIKVLCRIGKINYAVELLNCMVNDGFNLDERICSYILKSMCEQKECNGTEIMCFLEHLRKLGFCPNRDDWCNVIQLLVHKENSSEEAMKALSRMKMDKIEPDIVCYNLILNRLILEEDYRKADQVFDKMLVLGLVPNIFTYNPFINGLCQQNKVDEGIKMLESMDELGCKPDLITYNTILRAVIRERRMNLAREIITKIETKGMQLNSETYDLIFSGLLGNSELEESCDLDFLKEMIKRVSFYDSFEFFDNVICGLCQRGMHQTAFEVVQKMGDKSISPGIRSWEALLQESGFMNHSSVDFISPIIE